MPYLAIYNVEERGAESALLGGTSQGIPPPCGEVSGAYAQFLTRTLTTLDLDMPRFDACSESSCIAWLSVTTRTR
jgi:hypothetical protein